MAYLTVKSINDISVLDAQMEVWPLKYVPDALIGPLFSDLPMTPLEGKVFDALDPPPLRTFALLNAARVPGAHQLLETSGLPVRSLFKGDAKEKLQDVAPYLIQISARSEFTRRLFTSIKDVSPDLTSLHLWPREAVIYFRARTDIDSLQRHLRRFSRLKDAQGKWYYFNFSAPEYAPAYFASLTENAERVRQWFLCEGVVPIDMFLPDAKTGTCLHLSPNGAVQLGKPNQQICYGNPEHEAFLTVKRSQFAARLDTFLIAEVPGYATRDKDDRMRHAEALVVSAQKFSIRIEKAVSDFVLAGTLFGPSIEMDARMHDILLSEHHPLDRARMLLSEVRSREPTRRL